MTHLPYVHTYIVGVSPWSNGNPDVIVDREPGYNSPLSTQRTTLWLLQQPILTTPNEIQDQIVDRSRSGTSLAPAVLERTQKHSRKEFHWFDSDLH